MAYTIYGAIDVGSNDVSLTIYEITTKSGIRQLDRISRMMGLGSESYINGKINYQKVDELCEVLQEYKVKLQEYGAAYYQAYASSAIREASNSEMILDQVAIRTGMQIIVMSNSEIRFLIYKAMAYKKANFNKITQKSTAIVDIGAGSIQISLFDKQAVYTTQNIRIGSLRMREILSDIEYRTVNFNELIQEYVGNEINTFKAMFLKDKDIKNVIAVGDEISNIIKMVPELNLIDSINSEQMDNICQKLESKSVDELYTEFGIPQEVGSLLYPSAIIYKQFLEQAKAELIWIPLTNLCDGMAVDYAQKVGKIQMEHDFDADILAAARNISKRYRCDKAHIQNVGAITLSLFDKIRKLHGLGDRERLLLELAVILHDCGKFINMNAAAPNSYHIIMATEIIGISHKEREQVANIVKYNTASLPPFEEMDNKGSVEEYLKAAKLSAILKIANALDRSHKQKIENFTVMLKGKNLIILADTIEDLTLERGLFETKADHFEEVYGIRPVLKQKRRV